MDINNYITPIAGIVGIVLSTITFFLTYQQLNKHKVDKTKELHSRYAKIKELTKNIDENYSEILILLSGITKAELTKEEIQWFISEPGAFLKIELYGKVYGRYCNINLEKGEFSLNERISTTKNKIIEKIKIVIFGLISLSIMFAIWIFVIHMKNTTSLVYMALFSLSIYSLLIILGVNLIWNTIDKAVKLKGKPLTKIVKKKN